MSGLLSSLPSSPLSLYTSDKYWVDKHGTAHEACKLLFFADGKFLGESNYDPGSAPSLGYRRGGAAFFCPDCGEIWGRVVYTDSAGKTWFEEVVKVPCQRHYSQWEVAGSFLGGYRNEGYLDWMPLAVLQREFLLHLKEIGEEK